jgi:hypothetical protein
VEITGQQLNATTSNYTASHENSERLKAWQQWYNEQQRIWE